MWAAGTALAVLSAGAAAAGGTLTGDGAPNPVEPTASPNHRSASSSSTPAAPKPGPLSAADTDSSEPSEPVGGRAWPVVGAAGARPTVARGWEPPPAPWAPGHRGVDLLASAKATVRAAAPGRVLFAGKVAGRGVLSIEVSASGTPPLRTTYEPVEPTVQKGDHVTAGQPVATLGPGPFHCSGPCLHWGLLRDKTYLDPLSLLPPSMLHPAPSRLLPVTGVPEPSDASGPRDASPPGHSRATGFGRSRVQTRAPPYPASPGNGNGFIPRSRQPTAPAAVHLREARGMEAGRRRRGGPGRKAAQPWRDDG
ncbi:murein hydrolase activator EnvC family protein [Streptomyces sp. NPDC018019]|uniref:murein hydrolase activator EnvC family protein n=1 Tax=Streptomyces sp. NPDC018019 TaxID=3365030 RepID=UPI0037B0D0F6